MANMWFWSRGREFKRELAYTLPVRECEQLGMTQGDFLTDLSRTPKFNVDSKIGSTAGYEHVVVEIGEEEAGPAALLAGYYHLHLDPEEVIERMGKPPRSPMADGP